MYMTGARPFEKEPNPINIMGEYGALKSARNKVQGWLEKQVEHHKDREDYDMAWWFVGLFVNQLQCCF